MEMANQLLPTCRIALLLGMAISESLLKRAEAAVKNADPSVFKKSCPFSLGMEDWFSDTLTILKNPPRKQQKSMSLEKEKSWQNRFERVKKKLRNLQRVFYPRNMTAGLSTLSRRGDA